MMRAADARAILEALKGAGRIFPSQTRAWRRLLRDIPYIIAYDDGRKTLAEVGKQFGCTRQNVSVILRRHGIRREQRAQLNEARDAALREIG